MIYMDNAATTAMYPEVLASMEYWLVDNYSNPSGVYRPAVVAKNAINTARDHFIRFLGGSEEYDHLFFTSGGSEANNMAIRGTLSADQRFGNHVITTAVEHPSVLNTLRALEREGLATVTYLTTDKYGMVSAEQVRDAIRDDTVLVSVMFANNEVGTINPIMEIGEVCTKEGVLFHVDAVQAFGSVPINVNAMGIDLLSFSGHKFHGPKGIGGLYSSSSNRITPLIYGGEQERGYRAGTENVAGIIGMHEAMAMAQQYMSRQAEYVSGLRDSLIEKLLHEFPDAVLNGHPTNRLPNNVNISIPGIHSDSLLVLLDMNGICASAGSACTAGLSEPSHVLTAMGLPDSLVGSAIRLTLSPDNTIEEVNDVVRAIVSSVETLRKLGEKR